MTDVIDPETTETHLEPVMVKQVAVPSISPEMFDALDKMPEGFSLEQAYLVFDKPGTSRRVFYIGMTEMYSPEQKRNIPAAMFLWRNPDTGAIQRAINAGDNLVRQLQSCPVMENGTPVQITFVGKEKANTGRNFNKFEVIVLNPTAAAQMKKPTEGGVKDQRQIAHEWASKTRANADNAEDVKAAFKDFCNHLNLTKPDTVTTIQGAVDWLKEQTAN